MDNFDTREIVRGVVEVTINGVEVMVDKDRVNALTEFIEGIEDIKDIDPNYPTMDELDNMDSFLSHYDGFRHKIDDGFSRSDTIALYAVYISTTRD